MLGNENYINLDEYCKTNNMSSLRVLKILKRNGERSYKIGDSYIIEKEGINRAILAEMQTQTQNKAARSTSSREAAQRRRLRMQILDSLITSGFRAEIITAVQARLASADLSVIDLQTILNDIQNTAREET